MLHNRIKNITPVILAGGKSSRFGSDKALASFDQRNSLSILQHLFTLLSKTVGAPLVSINRSAKYPEYSHRECIDLLPNAGPLSGIHAVMSSSPETDHFLVVTCDMPMLTADAIKLLIESYSPSDDVCCLEQDGRVHAFPGLYSRRILPQVVRGIQSQNKSMKSLISNLDHVRVISIQKNSDVMFNMNTHIDWLKFIKSSQNKEDLCPCPE